MLALVLILGFLFWDRYAVVTRSATQQIRTAEFVLAAEACGASKARIIAGEILPNVLNQIIVVATLEMAIAILVEAALSFLGLGTAAADAVLGPDGLRGPQLHVLQALSDRDSGRRDLPARHRDQHDGRRRARRHRAGRTELIGMTARSST